MGTTDTTASPASAEELRKAMVDRLLSWGGVRTARVEAALRIVPRHLFVPNASLEQAYANDSVITFRNAAGIAISSASGPGVVAAMLEQLEVQPGHRVLEIGAGTGYNAACLAELTGPNGRVTTIDIGQDIAAGARRGLDAAGYPGVRVVCGDGAEGVPDNAPYDRIIITAGAWDLPPAWREQLAPDGRLVVPLRMRGVTRSVALEPQGDAWGSVSINECGFMPIRGEGPSAVEELNIELPERTGVRIRVDDGRPVDVHALGTALSLPPTLAWSGVVVPLKPFEHLDFWLAGTSADLCRLLVTPKALEAGLVKPIYPWGSMGCYTADTFAYLVRRDSADGMHTELGACAYGPDSKRLADEVANRIKAWGAVRDSLEKLRVEVHPTGSPDRPSLLTTDKAYSRIFVLTA